MVPLSPNASPRPPEGIWQPFPFCGQNTKTERSYAESTSML